MSVNVERTSFVTKLYSNDLAVVCLWSCLGLALTGLAASLGFGSQIAEILAQAG